MFAVMVLSAVYTGLSYRHHGIVSGDIGATIAASFASSMYSFHLIFFGILLGGLASIVSVIIESVRRVMGATFGLLQMTRVIIYGIFIALRIFYPEIIVQIVES